MDYKKESKFYITTPIFYPNANLHMGHAYTTCLADILARYNRLKGKEIYFLTGADENTEKVIRIAKRSGKETKEYLDEIVSGFKNLFEKLGISYDQFIRTSDEEKHWPGAQDFWRKLVKAGDIEKRSYEGLYCVGHEAFITEKELVNGKCPEHDEAPQTLKEENYFFKLSRYSESIKEKIINGELEIIPQSRKNEILALLERGLEDISFSRPAEKMTVGIPVPDDPTQKIYVWGDALTNYVTALGFDRNTKLFNKFWPADVHVIGKDILRFHAAIWPAMLLSADLELPQKIFVHGFITSGGKKMSKTLGNVIDPNMLIDEYGAEAVRYYLARHISPFEDGDLTLESFKEAYNANLANGLGNLVSRVMKLAETHLSSPAEMKEKMIHSELQNSLDKFEIQKAISHIWKEISELDLLIQREEPWKVVKSSELKGKEVIFNLVKKLSHIAYTLSPFMPETSKSIEQAIRENKMPEKPLFPRRD